MPIVMGILNITPDSFSDGGLYLDKYNALKQAEQLIKQGADILDIGGQSTKPGSKRISAQEECDRILPVIEMIHQHYPKQVMSVDTYYPEVAEHAIKAGVSMINDVTACSHETMYAVAKKYSCPLVLMHNPHLPEQFHAGMQYNNLLESMVMFFKQKMQEASTYQVNDIIIDPGFGFGKTVNENFYLLQQIHQLHVLNTPMLVGISKKSFIYKTISCKPQDALIGTSFLHAEVLNQGVHILRVHDVVEAKQCIALHKQLKANKNKAQQS